MFAKVAEIKEGNNVEGGYSRSDVNKATYALRQAVASFDSNQTNALGSSRHKSGIITTGNVTA
jgi:hypothetical protein